MKKSLILGALSLAATIATTYGQGQIWLDNYDSTAHPTVKYGAGSGGTLNNPVNTAYTAGLYFVSGSQVGAFAADPTGTALPTSLFSGTGTLTLASGTGATGNIANATDVFGTLGQYAPAQTYQCGIGAGATVTVMIIAYNDGSYANATVRGHSTAFTMVTSVGTAVPAYSGDSETDGGFQVLPVPEPSVFALSGLGAAALMLIRRKK
jgi:hypothetical protein